MQRFSRITSGPAPMPELMYSRDQAVVRCAILALSLCPRREGTVSYGRVLISEVQNSVKSADYECGIRAPV